MSNKFDPPSASDRGESLRLYLRRFIEKLNKCFTEQSVKEESNAKELAAVKKELKNVSDRVSLLTSKLGEESTTAELQTLAYDEDTLTEE